MKSHFLIISILFIINYSSAQTPVYEKDFSVFQFSSTINQFERISKKEFLLISRDSLKLELIKYNEQLEELFVTPLKHENYRYYTPKINIHTNDIFLFKQSGKKKNYSGEGILISGTNGEVLGKYDWWNKDKIFSQIAFSPSGGLALAYNLEDKKTRKVTMRILKTDLSKYSESSYTLSKKDKFFEPDIFSDEEFMLTTLAEKPSTFNIVFFDSEGNLIKEVVTPINLKGSEYYAEKILYQPEENPNLKLLAFSRKEKDEIKGIDIWKIDGKSRAISFFKQIDLDKEYLENRVYSNYYSSPLSEQNDPTVSRAEKVKRLKDFRLTSLLLEDERIILIIEDKWSYSASSSNGTGFREYQSNNIIMLSHDTAGEFLWANMLERNADHRDIGHFNNFFKPRFSNIDAFFAVNDNYFRMVFSERKGTEFFLNYREIDLNTGQLIKSKIFDEDPNFKNYCINSHYSGWLDFSHIVLMTATGTDWFSSEKVIRLKVFNLD